MKKSPQYTYSIEVLEDGREVLCIVDVGGPTDMSLTNGIETALKEIRNSRGEPLPALIIYRDSLKIWDRVVNTTFRVSFISLNQTHLAEALHVLNIVTK